MNKLLLAQCLLFSRKKSMIVSDNTTDAEGLGDFFNNPIINIKGKIIYFKNRNQK